MASWLPGVTWALNSQLRTSHLAKAADCHGKPVGHSVITATQMLDSMVHSPDRLALKFRMNAILDGTDAVMLSNETAVASTRSKPWRRWLALPLGLSRKGASINPCQCQNPSRSIPNAISQAVSQIAEQLGAAAIMTDENRFHSGMSQSSDRRPPS